MPLTTSLVRAGLAMAPSAHVRVPNFGGGARGVGGWGGGLPYISPKVVGSTRLSVSCYLLGWPSAAPRLPATIPALQASEL